MRSAILLACLLVPAAFPLSAATVDECAPSLCVKSPPVQGKTYYVYAEAAKCAATLFDADCSGRPAAQGSTAPLKFVGVLYQESNGLGGLQRKAVSLPPDHYDPDKMILL